MRFEDQYPGIENHLSIGSKLARKHREDILLEQAKYELKQKSNRREMIGFALLLPTIVLVGLLIYFFAWAIIPTSMW